MRSLSFVFAADELGGGVFEDAGDVGFEGCSAGLPSGHACGENRNRADSVHFDPGLRRIRQVFVAGIAKDRACLITGQCA